ncbi:MAG: SpvB/TcaC N-terminal domain-containing protein [Bacteroidota bacterium]
MEKKFFYSAILVIAFIVLCGHKEEIKHPDREGASEEVSEIGAYSIFSASEGPKQIGQTHRAQMGDPSSNVFHFEIDTDPEKASTAWLSYCIKGLKNYASLTRNINHREAKGGYLIARDDGWNQQKEFLDPAWLKQGQNSIRISVPEDLVGQVFIQEVQLVLEWPEKADVLSGRSLFVDEHAVLQGNGRVYLNGFLTGPDKETAVICINDQTVQNWDGEFEEILVLEDFQVDSVSIVINAFYADGSSCTEEISVPQQSLQMPVDIRPFEERRRRTKAHIRPGVSRTLELGTAAIRLSSKSLTNATSLSITGLREVDLPSLPSNIINVTGESAGFRFLPHGMVFADDVQIVLPYNAGLIPKGYSSNDVQSFFFDDESQSWQALQRDSLLDYPAKIVSRSNHFTDFIAGIIKVPESPETQSFIKTSLSDIKAANPGEGIHQMEMPEATHLGQVNLSYPLNLPLGRKGLGPELRVTYNSDGANSWMGMGWNLAVPAISTETRWGVPLYLPAKESETYLLNGEKLSPQAHRLPNFESRTSEKQFYLRVEGSFQKIIRHGSSPKNYWWEVTDKAGRRSFFGGRPGVGVVENAVLKDLQGNIAHWGMVEVRDLHQNFIRYHWAVKLDQGTPLSPNIGKDLYLQKITYTGHQQTEGAYEVKLIRDDQLGESKRKDVSISCLLGLKRVSASLLRKVEIRFKGKMIRSYAFNYTEGAFYKTLLSSLIEYDQAGKEFTRHEMEYLDEVRNGGIYRPYFSRQRWNIPDDDLNGNFINPINGFRDNVSALHGSKSKNRGSSFSITFGRGWNLTSKRSSIGGNFSFDTSIGEGLLALVDINGDKLPDKVFIENGRIYYRSNSGQDIGAKKLIYGLSQFSSSKSKSRGLGFEVHPFPFTISRGKNVTESITETFFADFNSDGYIDIAYKGLVFFGYRNSQGEIAFTRFSDLTPNPVQSGAPLDPILAPNDSLIQEEMIDNFPLHDMVRMWEAPRDGVIKINAPVQLIQDTSQIAQADTLRDGVRVAIQHKGTELWSKIIGPDDHLLKVPVGVNTVPVEQGDRIYFRVQSIQNGSSDQVIWDPEITYANISVNEKDAQNHAVYRYKASEDFVNTSCQSLYLPYDGIVKIEGSFNKGFLSDEIDVEILRRDSQGNDSLILKSNFPNDTIINNLNLSFTVPFGKDDEVFFRVKSQTNVDWGNITWTPRVYYTLAQDSLGNAIQVVENGTYLIDYCPAVDFSMYNHLVQPSEVFMPNSDHNLVIYPSFGFLNYPFPQTPEWESGTVTLSLKGINKTYQKVVYDITNNTVVGLPGSLIFPVKKDSIYFVELHFSSYALLKQADTLQLSGNYYGPYGIHSVLPGEKLILGPYHRGWGHFVYNGNRGRADSAIQEHLLVPDPNLENPQDH